MLVNKLRSLRLFFVPVYALYFCLVVSIVLIYFHNDFSIAHIFYFISFSLAIFGLNAYNQIQDYNLDKISKKFRPLIRSQISFSEAKVICILLYLFSITLNLVFFNQLVLGLLLIFIVLSFVYSRNFLNLRANFGSNIFGSLFYGLIPLLLAQILIQRELFILTFFFTINTFLIASLKDFEDSDADRTFGIRTLPNTVGKPLANKLLSSLFFIVALLSGILLTLKNAVFLYFVIFMIYVTIGVLLIEKVVSDETKNPVIIGLAYNFFFLVLQLFFY